MMKDRTADFRLARPDFMLALAFRTRRRASSLTIFWVSIDYNAVLLLSMCLDERPIVRVLALRLIRFTMV